MVSRIELPLTDLDKVKGIENFPDTYTIYGDVDLKNVKTIVSSKSAIVIRSYSGYSYFTSIDDGGKMRSVAIDEYTKAYACESAKVTYFDDRKNGVRYTIPAHVDDKSPNESVTVDSLPFLVTESFMGNYIDHKVVQLFEKMYSRFIEHDRFMFLTALRTNLDSYVEDLEGKDLFRCDF